MNHIGAIVFFFCTFLPLFHMFHALPFFSEGRRKVKPRIPEEGVSILIPCYNENYILETTLKGLLQLDYRHQEIIFINDGSTDNTFEVLYELLDLVPLHWEKQHDLPHKPIVDFYQSKIYPEIFLLDKVNGGKADALNAGCNFATKPIIVTLDADSILDQKALKEVNLAFHNPNVIAGGGMVHILQGKNMHDINLNNKWLISLQIFEYLKGFYIYKSSLARLNALAIISGAFGVFRKSILLELGGYRETLGEDIDITLRFQQWILKHPGSKMLFIPDAICYTECPESWRDLFKQRIRWQKAFVDCVLHFWGFLARTIFHRIVSFFLLFDAFFMGTVATIVTTCVLTASFFMPQADMLQAITAYFIGSLILNFIYNLFTIYISYSEGVRFKGRNKWRLILLIFIDIFLYRFVTLFFIFYGTIAYVFKPTGWNKVARTGRDYQIHETNTRGEHIG
ncbi:Glycosyltransferase, catalytic subunit of cellulose synthase and poly-beta-1,6-N-acetylglucosamine synthase [Seinonella peptonophila]|uniref:Glycosyltransferase, catalytic subunit of cellulose synthase and poly-beta-1,6-N-acetylglucosamine synthase n=1 Tax=Seinonella peptonophila TaxID=112248 RepID=A0A1M4TZT6_9BACL|nr:glycosyltransferase [Seinonella peptonophila]SHE50031.1 Glycosyltransferase, catalytic subunit of cellulose synthase and poly-beta-1,6-N-acetylglucosamine synthase [Seinonella peptonophila]